MTPDEGLLEPPRDELALAGAALRRPFLLSAPRVRVTGTESGGVREVRIPGGTLAGDVTGGAGAASGVVADPWRIRRELTSPAGSVLETVLAPERLPGLVVQWSGPGVAAIRPSLVLPGVTPARVSGHGGAVVEAPGPGGGVRLVRLAPGGVLRARPEGGGVRLDGEVSGEPPGELPGDGPDRTTLVVAWGEDAAQARSRVAVLSRTTVLEGWARGAAEGAEGLRLRSGVPELDGALAWARARLRSRPAFEGEPPGPPSFLEPGLERCLAVLALLAVGDGPGAATVAAGLDPATTAGVLARSWLTAWRGGTGAVRAERDALLGWAGRPPDADPDPLRPLARAALADALEVAGHEGEAEAVRAETAPSGARRLPMVGQAPSAAKGRPRDTVAAALRGQAGTGGGGQPVEGAGALLEAWRLAAAGLGEEGYALLRGATVPRREPDAGPYLAGEAATLLPLALVCGLLGARADAGYGRLRLAPALPGSWTRFRVDGLALGEARLDLLYRREDGSRTFTLRPSAGGVPATVVFEPVVGGGVREVEIDGAPASVETEVDGSRTRVRLQLPVDAERTIRITGDDAP